MTDQDPSSTAALKAIVAVLCLIQANVWHVCCCTHVDGSGIIILILMIPVSGASAAVDGSGINIRPGPALGPWGLVPAGPCRGLGPGAWSQLVPAGVWGLGPGPSWSLQAPAGSYTKTPMVI
jgi:hypothetical protein